jgi:hypothetical protein
VLLGLRSTDRVDRLAELLLDVIAIELEFRDFRAVESVGVIGCGLAIGEGGLEV